MFKTVYGVLMTSAMVLIAINAMAQELPKGRWWNEPNVVKALKLTGDEVEKLEKRFSKRSLERGMLRNMIGSEKRKLKKFMANPEKNEAAIRKHNDELEKAQSLLADTNPSFYKFVKNLLGEARLEKLKKVEY